MASVQQDDIPTKFSLKTIPSISTTASSSATISTTNPSMSSTTAPRLTRTLAAVLCVTTLAAKIPGIGKEIVNNFALLPVATVGQSKLWNVVTAGFFDTNVIAASVNLALFFMMGKWIESSWGPRSLLFYLIIVNTLSAICTYVSMLAAYVISRIDTFFFTAVGTTNGICVALLIAIKQLIPEHEIGSASIKVTANYLPLIYITVTIVMTFVSFFSSGVLVFTLSAFQSSWMYLRYFQFNSTDNVYGDLSDTFAYPTLFPQPIRKPVSIFANIVFTVLKPILLAAQGPRNVNGDGNGNVNGAADENDLQPSSNASTMDTERRTQRALKVLDERIQASISTGNSEDNITSQPDSAV